MSRKITKQPAIAEGLAQAKIINQFAAIRVNDLHSQIKNIDRPILRWVYSKKILDLKKERQVWFYVMKLAAQQETFLYRRLDKSQTIKNK